MNKKSKYLQFLGSKNFPIILKEYNLEFLKHNKFIALHLLSIATQSNGIKEGHIRLEYVFSTEDHFTKDTLGPKLNFSFYMNSYALIENTNTSTRSSAKIRNLNDFTSVDFKNAYSFKKFLLNQELQMKHLPGHTWKSVMFDKIDINYKKPVKIERENYFYEIIIDNNPELKNFLDFYFMNIDLKNKIVHQTDVFNVKKIKI